MFIRNKMGQGKRKPKGIRIHNRKEKADLIKIKHRLAEIKNAGLGKSKRIPPLRVPLSPYKKKKLL